MTAFGDAKRAWVRKNEERKEKKKENKKRIAQRKAAQRMEEERINADGDGDTEMSGVVSSQVGSGDTVGSARRKPRTGEPIWAYKKRMQNPPKAVREKMKREIEEAARNAAACVEKQDTGLSGGFGEVGGVKDGNEGVMKDEEMKGNANMGAGMHVFGLAFRPKK